MKTFLRNRNFYVFANIMKIHKRDAVIVILEDGLTRKLLKLYIFTKRRIIILKKGGGASSWKTYGTVSINLHILCSTFKKPIRSERGTTPRNLT